MEEYKQKLNEEAGESGSFGGPNWSFFPLPQHKVGQAKWSGNYSNIKSLFRLIYSFVPDGCPMFVFGVKFSSYKIIGRPAGARPRERATDIAPRN